MAVKQRQDGRWIAYYRDKRTGKVIHEYFGRGPGGEAAARARSDEIALSRRKKKDKAGPLFGDLAGAYLENHRFNANSARQLAIRLAANILPFFGDLPALAITSQDLDDYVRRRRSAVWFRHGKRHVGVKDATISRELTDVKAVLNFAVRRSPPLIAYNPVAAYQKPGENDLARIQPPTTDEAEAILAVAAPHLVRVIRLAWFTGIRPGAAELLSLTWDRVHFDRGVMVVTGAEKGKKLARLRSVPIHKALLPDLAAWHRADKGKGHVVHYRGRAVKCIRHAWDEAKKRAGITRRLRPYDLRHCFVTAALESGADVGALARIVGSRPETLQRFYQHVSKELEKRTVDVIRPLAIHDNTDHENVLSMTGRKCRKSKQK